MTHRLRCGFLTAHTETINKTGMHTYRNLDFGIGNHVQRARMACIWPVLANALHANSTAEKLTALHRIFMCCAANGWEGRGGKVKRCVLSSRDLTV
jgi:hypothetical protein